MKGRLLLLCAACGWAGCEQSSDPIQAGAERTDAGVAADSLAVSFEPTPGSFDDLHTRVLLPRCSGQPGLCHNGQFEPNLSTPGLAYVELVGRAGLERPERLRVQPMQPAQSLLIDKLRDREVSTLMPLGAQALSEAEIASIEAWIEQGALREPGGAAQVQIDLPPRAPELGIFDSTGKRLDGAGRVVVKVGDTLSLRHSVQDFETSDATIPFSAVRLQLATGEGIAISDDANSPDLGNTTFDAMAPSGPGDALNRVFPWTVPAEVTVIDGNGQKSVRSALGLSLTLVALYTDKAAFLKAPVELGYVRVAVQQNAIEVQ